MYHRYMPDGNGQYRRQDVPDRKPAPPQPPIPAPPQREPAPPFSPPPPQSPPPLASLGLNPVSFLEKLFPGMDSGDLLLLLIMLLLLSEGTEDAVSTVMTLAIFLILQ